MLHFHGEDQIPAYYTWKITCKGLLLLLNLRFLFKSRHVVSPWGQGLLDSAMFVYV